jgi:hypothetical protein
METAILGPSRGSLVRVPSPVDGRTVGILLLGEVHSQLPHGWRTMFTVVDLLRLATQRAAAQGAVVDFLQEVAVDRGRWVDGQLVRNTDDPYGFVGAMRGGSLEQLAAVLAGSTPPPHGARVTGDAGLVGILDPRHARVHAFDARPQSVLDGGSLSPAVYHCYVGPCPAAYDDRFEEWSWFLMGFDAGHHLAAGPAPPEMLEALERDVVSGHQLERWLAIRARMAGKIRKRAGKLGLEEARRLAALSIETADGGDPDLDLPWWGRLFASTSDFYLLLRIFAPYDGAGQASLPRHCIVYAGASHTDHVTRVLTRMAGGRDVPPPQEKWPKLLKVADVWTPAAGAAGLVGPADTVGRLLDLIGLDRPGRSTARPTPFTLSRGPPAPWADPTGRLFALLGVPDRKWTMRDMYEVRVLLADTPTVRGDKSAIVAAVLGLHGSVVADILAADAAGGGATEADRGEALVRACSLMDEQTVRVLVEAGTRVDTARASVPAIDRWTESPVPLRLPPIVVAAFGLLPVIDLLAPLSPVADCAVARRFIESTRFTWMRMPRVPATTLEHVAAAPGTLAEAVARYAD